MNYNDEISQDLLQGIIEGSHNPYICVKITTTEGDESLTFILMNKAFEDVYGENAKGMKNATISFAEIAEMGSEDELINSIIETYKTGEDVYRVMEIPYIGKIFVLKAYNAASGYVCVSMSDVTEVEKDRREAVNMYDKAVSTAEQLKYQVDLLAATKNQLENTSRIHEIVAQSSNNGFYYKHHKQGTFFASDSWYNLFTVEGVRPFDSKNMINAISEDDLGNYTRWREKAIADCSASFACEFRLCGNLTWLEASFRFIYDENNKLCEEVAYFNDITINKVQKEELAYKAYYDVVTGLMNRTYLTKCLDDDILRAKEEDVSVEVIYIDIDNFKEINDCIGFNMADEYILKVAMILQSYESETIRVARYDSDEFVIVVYDGSRHQALSLAVEIKKKLSEPMSLSNGITHNLTVSIGIAQYPDGGKKAVDIIGNADIALRKVKDTGKNGILFFDDTMLEQFMNKMEMENTIKRALVEDRFELYYQPQYYTSSCRLRGVEALIRMHDDVLGFIGPNQFIHLAEKNGTIVDIGEWVLRHAFEDLRNWQLDYDFGGIMSINISPIQFKQVTFESTLYSLIKEYNIKPDRIEIEITESVFVENEFEFTEMIKRIRNNGIKVSLDDFGTGYSSLAYLKNIPIDTLKIDKAFIDSLGEMKSSDIITSSLIDMIQKLGLEIIAEGVETQVQFDFLKKMKCDDIQGYYLARPMNSESIKAVIREESC